MSDKTVSVRLQLEVGQYKSAAGEAARATASVADAGDKASSRLTRSMGAAAKGVGVVTTAALAGGAALLTNALKTGAAYNTLEQTSRAAFKTILGSASAASKMMEQISEFAKTSPFPREVFIKGAQQLAAFGLKAEKIIPTMSAVQDSVAAAGGTSQTLSEIIFVLAQIQAAGKITAVDLMQMAQRGINGAELMGSALGKSGAEIKESITAGTLDAQVAMDALVKGMVKATSGAADGVKNTFVGAKDRVKGAWRDISSIIAEPFVQKGGGGLALDWANAFADLLRAIEQKAGPVVDIVMGRLGPGFDRLVPLIESAKSAVNGWDVRDLNGQLDSLGQYTPLIAGVTAALVAMGTNALPVLGKLPILGINPLVAGLVALAAATPEIRQAGLDFVQALSPLAPVAAEVGVELAGAATAVLSELAPAFAQVLTAVAPVVVQLGTGLAPALVSTANAAVPVASAIGSVAEVVAKIPTPVLATVAAFAALKALGLGSALTSAGAGATALGQQMRVQSALAAASTRQYDAFGVAVAGSGRQLSTVGSAASVASVGVSRLGKAMKAAFLSNPVGIAIAGVATAVSLFSSNAASARQSAEEMKGSLDQITGAATEATRALIAARLDEKGAFFNDATALENAKTLEISSGLVVDAITGVGDAYDEVKVKIEAGLKAGGDQEKAAQGLALALQGNKAQLDETGDAVRRQAEAANGGAAASNKYADALQRQANAARDAAGNAISQREAEIAQIEAVNEARAAIENKTKVSRTSTGAVKENAKSTVEADKALLRIANTSNSVVSAMQKNDVATSKVNKTMNSQRRAFIDTAVQMGYTREEAKALATQLGLTPKTVESMILAEDRASGKLDNVKGKLDDVDGSKAGVKVNASGNAPTVLQALRAQMATLALMAPVNLIVNTIRRERDERAGGGAVGLLARASGGSVSGPGTGTSDDIPAMLSNGEHVLTAAEVKKAGGQGAIYRLRAAIRAGLLPAFAAGGEVSRLEILNQQRTVRDLEKSLREREAYGKKRKGKKRPTRLVLKPGSLDRRIAQQELAEAKAELSDLKTGRESRREAALKRREARADARQKRIDDAISARDSVASGLSGQFGVGKFTGVNELGVYGNLSGGSIAAGAKAFAAKVKSFATKLEKARKLGIPVRMLQEIGGLGVDEGTQALDALLGSSTTDIATIQTAYRDIDTYAKGAGDVIAKALDLQSAGRDSAQGFAKGFVDGMNSYADTMKKAKENAVKGKKTPGVKAPSKGPGLIGIPLYGATPTKSSSGSSASGSQGPYTGPGVAGKPLYSNAVAATTTVIAPQLTAEIKSAVSEAMTGWNVPVNIGNREASKITQLGNQTDGRQG